MILHLTNTEDKIPHLMGLQYAGKHLNKSEDLEWIESQLEAFSDALEKAELYNELYDDFVQPIQQPIVKEKKVYPNEPCPCGSGKNIRNAVKNNNRNHYLIIDLSIWVLYNDARLMR